MSDEFNMMNRTLHLCNEPLHNLSCLPCFSWLKFFSVYSVAQKHLCLSVSICGSKRGAVFEHVVYDSDIELEFAIAFEQSDDIKLYARLPDWFKIDTPLGIYNPDRAVLIVMDGKEKLYFVVETKSTILPRIAGIKKTLRSNAG